MSFSLADYGGDSENPATFAELSDSGPTPSEAASVSPVVLLPHQQQQQQPDQQQSLGNELKIAAARANPFVTGYDPSSPEEMMKRQQRAERFGIPLFYHGMEPMDTAEDGGPGAPADAVEAAEEHLQRTEKFGIVDFEIDVDGPEREHYMMDLTSVRRFDTILLYGTKLANENVKTRHVMEYYKIYGVRHVEWLGAVRCNVVFADAGGARRAMMNTSSPLLRKTQLDDDTKQKLQALGAAPHDLEFLCWRVCQSHGGAGSSLLCRVATTMDVKAPLEERRKSKYYSIYWKQNLDELMRRKQRQMEKEAEQARLKVVSLKELRLKRGLPAMETSEEQEEQAESGITFGGFGQDEDDADADLANDAPSAGAKPIRAKPRGRGHARAFTAIKQSSKPQLVLRR